MRYSYEIIGNNFQLVRIKVTPDINVFSEPGKMLYTEGNINISSKMLSPRKGFLSSLSRAVKRKIAGEDMFLLYYEGEGYVGISSRIPGTIFPINLNETGEVILQKGAFLCGIGDIDISVFLQKSLGVGIFGREGLLLQRIKGDGLVFVSVLGDLEIIELQNSSMQIHVGALAGWSGNLNLSVQTLGIKEMLFSKMGLFLINLQGTGKVFVQSFEPKALKQFVLADADDKKNKT